MIEEKHLFTFRCDIPGCCDVLVVDDQYDLDSAFRKAIKAGWYATRNLRWKKKPHYCPEHKEEAYGAA